VGIDVSVLQLRKELIELKREAVKIPNRLVLIDKTEELKAREEMKKELWELEEKIQRYRDIGVFGKKDHSVNRDFDFNCVDGFSIELVRHWQNRHLLTLEESLQLYRDIGLFVD
jgi:hypothetical protein